MVMSTEYRGNVGIVQRGGMFICTPHTFTYRHNQSIPINQTVPKLSKQLHLTPFHRISSFHFDCQQLMPIPPALSESAGESVTQ